MAKTARKAAPTHDKASSVKVVHIPLHALHISASNVRSKDTTDISQLSASIFAKGIISNLNVVEDSGKYAVVAGGRRLRALRALLKAKKITKDYLVPCRVVEETAATAVSLAENTQREPMHPADQLAAFQRLIDEGKSVEDIASDFGLAKLVVTQRLKLANLAPTLLAAFRSDNLKLDTMMAYALLDDHAEQERIFQSLPKYQRGEAHYVRQCIVGSDVKPTAPLAKYVGVDVYEAAGGGFRNDLFGSAESRGLVDLSLLTKLGTEKMEKTAKKVRKEGWGWVECYPEVNHAAAQACKKMPTVLRPATDDEALEIKRLAEALEALDEREAELNDNEALSEDEYSAASDAIETERQSLADRESAITTARVLDDAEFRQHAGAILSLTHDGRLKIERGLVRGADWGKVRKLANPAPDEQETGGRTERDANEANGISDALCRSMTAERTLALRAVFAGRPETALVAVVHAMVLSEFFDDDRATSLNLAVSDKSRIEGAAPHAVQDSLAWASLNERRTVLAAALPPSADALWDWLAGQRMETLLAYLAFCASRGVDAVIDSTKSRHTWGGQDYNASHQLAAALEIDMAEWWKPTAESYLGRVKKSALSAALVEAGKPDAASQIEKMKKADAVAAAAIALEGTGWLPELLRRRGA